MQLQSDVPDVSAAIKPAPVAYTRIPDAVLLDSRLTPGQLRIYAVIARRADRDKATAFPSYKTIAADAHVSRTSAIDGVKVLVQLGYLSKRAQESGQGDPTSNLYTISGEGSQIFVLPRPNTTSSSQQAVPKLDHRSADFAPQVVQPLDQGGADFGPEQDSLNKKKEDKTQENGRTRAQAREIASPPAAAADPELQKLFNDFHENIGTLTAMAQEIIGQLSQKHGADQVRDAIQEAVIYEKRSLAYIRRVLDAWRRNGRVVEPTTTSSSREWMWSDYPTDMQPSDAYSDLPFFKLINDVQLTKPDMSNPAVAAWEAINREVPQLRRFAKYVTPVSLTDNVLTMTVQDSRTYTALRFFVACATETVLTKVYTLRVELAEGKE
jgi:DnaD/phage-associated family protein